MSEILNLEKQIARLEKEGFDDSADRVKLFKKISGVESYIFGDTEDYLNPSDYYCLLDNINELLQGVVMLEQINTEKSENGIIVNFTVNGSKKEIVLPEDTDWIQPKIFLELNKYLKEAGSNAFIRSVYMEGIDFADQCMELCFIDDEVYEELKNHPNQYAG